MSPWQLSGLAMSFGDVPLPCERKRHSSSDGGRIISCIIWLISCESKQVTSIHLEGVEPPSDIARKAKRKEMARVQQNSPSWPTIRNKLCLRFGPGQRRQSLIVRSARERALLGVLYNHEDRTPHWLSLHPGSGILTGRKPGLQPCGVRMFCDRFLAYQIYLLRARHILPRGWVVDVKCS